MWEKRKETSDKTSVQTNTHITCHVIVEEIKETIKKASIIVIIKLYINNRMIEVLHAAIGSMMFVLIK